MSNNVSDTLNFDSIHIKEHLVDCTRKMDDIYNNIEKSNLYGIPTGIKKIDDATSGLKQGELCVIAGLTGMGKSSLALNMTLNICDNLKAPILWLTNEMTARDLTMRFISYVSMIPFNKISCKKLEEKDWPYVTAAVNTLKDELIYINEISNKTIDGIIKYMNDFILEFPEAPVIVIDCLQLIKHDKKNSKTTTAELTEVARQLKAFALENNITIIAISQVNKDVLLRTCTLPVIGDLKDSTSIGDNADIIISLSTISIYNDNNHEEPYYTSEISIMKNRMGIFNRFDMLFQKGCSRFIDPDDIDKSLDK